MSSVARTATLTAARTRRTLLYMTAPDDPSDQVRAERERRLVQRVEELTTDIGSVLHANTSILLMAQQSIDAAIRSLAPNPFPADTAPTFQEVDRVLTGPAQSAARALEKLLASLADRADVLSPRIKRELDSSAALLANHAEYVPIEESRASTLRTVACRVQDILNDLPSNKVRREHVRNARRSVHDIERCAVLASLLQTRSAILQMDYTIRSFREFVTSDMRPDQPATALDLSRLIESSISQLVEYALTSNVEIKVRNDAARAQVQGVERDLVRAVANLLHNAIKYSWTRDAGHKPWVGVDIRRDGRDVTVAIENWGVPISLHELSKDMVFELGYRGKWSTDRGRLGTGVGLTDSREVIQQHRGSIELESRPARSWGPDDPDDEAYYRQPFVTRVTFRLPEAL